ncbi:Gfo/Idh/MocA family protein [Sporosarcina sp. FA9]|uniref:Gfo/Idh/MocA family protein n=1 Tax=Sporosarcina sp. FA9 TaxID=3413030 RepID=UPI003F656C1A
MKIGLIGLDTSHSEIFTRLLNDTTDPNHIRGAKITHALPIFSEDLAMSRDRFPKYLSIVKDKYGVEIVNDVDFLFSQIDAVILGTVDGRNHLEWIEKIITYGKPIFVDKPIVMNSEEMEKVIKLSLKYGTPLMSSSSLRYADSVKRIRNDGMKDVVGGYIYGPLPIEKAMPGYFWYGIHMIEMVISLMGTDVKVIGREQSKNEIEFEKLTLLFNNKNEVIIRGDYDWHNRFGGVLHFENDVKTFQLWKEERPYYANLLEEMIVFFKTGISPVTLKETAEIIKLLEEINNWESHF